MLHVQRNRYSARRVVSVDSFRFFWDFGSSYACHMKIHDVRVTGWKAPSAILTNCPGPALLMDSVFKAPAVANAVVWEQAMDPFVDNKSVSIPVQTVITSTY